MSSKKMPKKLHLELLEEYGVTLTEDGQIASGSNPVIDDGRVDIGYRDDGPDAWSSSEHFDGPAWVWRAFEGWSFWKKGVSISGYSQLSGKVVNIKEDGVHVTHIEGVPY